MRNVNYGQLCSNGFRLGFPKIIIRTMYILLYSSRTTKQYHNYRQVKSYAISEVSGRIGDKEIELKKKKKWEKNRHPPCARF